jgi:hypothetical protein
MNVPRLLRVGLLSILVVGLALEALAWARLGVVDVVRESAPRPLFFGDGSVAFHEVEPDPDDRRRPVHRLWEADGTFVGVAPEDGDAPLSRRVRSAIHVPHVSVRRAAGVDRTFETLARVRRLWAGGDEPVSDLRISRRGAGHSTHVGRGSFRSSSSQTSGHNLDIRQPLDPSQPNATLALEGGAFVVRRTPDGRVLQRFGASGPLPSEGTTVDDPYGPLYTTASHVTTAPYVSRADVLIVLYESSPERLVEIRRGPTAEAPFDVVFRPIRRAPVEPARVPTTILAIDGVEHVRLFEPDGQLVGEMGPRPDDSNFRASFRTADVRGLFAPAAERGGWHPTLEATSVVATGDPLVVVHRLRRQMVGEAERTWEARWDPPTLGRRVAVVAGCLPAVLRPAPLLLASTISGLPDDRDDGSTWWWRDPVVAGGKRPLVVLANGLLSALCAFLAWRVGRVHCATRRGALAWTAAGFLGGGIALLLQRSFLVRAARDSVGGATRSLALDASPSSSDPWPRPAPRGTEIIEAG